MNNNFTVAEAVTLSPLNRGKVVAGHSGMDRIILSADVQEVNLLTVPNAVDFVRGSELLITSMYSVRESIDWQVELLHMLSSRGVAALVLCHLDMVLKQVDNRLLTTCDELGLPLIVMPADIGYSEIILMVSDAVLERNNQKLHSIIKVYDSISVMLMRSNSSDLLVREFKKLTGRDLMYFNHNTSLISSTIALHETPLDEITSEIKKNIPYFLSPITETPSFHWMEGIVRLYPLINNTDFFGVLAVLGNEDLSNIEHIAVVQTLNALCVSALGKISLLEQKKNMTTELVLDLLRGHKEDSHLLLMRAAELGINLDNAYGVILVDIFKFRHLAEKRNELELLNLKKNLLEFTETHLQTIARSYICCGSSDKVIIICIGEREPANPRTRMKTIAQSVFNYLSSKLETPVSVGVGSYANSLHQLQNSYQAAFSTIDIANSLLRVPNCSDSEDFPMYVLLSQLLLYHEDTAGEIVGSILEPLRKFDKQNNSDLLGTFRCLLSNDMDTAKTADNLYIHKNTVLQRKKKIESLYTIKPFDVVYRVQFNLAFLITDLLS